MRRSQIFRRWGRRDFRRGRHRPGVGEPWCRHRWYRPLILALARRSAAARPANGGLTAIGAFALFAGFTLRAPLSAASFEGLALSRCGRRSLFSSRRVPSLCAQASALFSQRLFTLFLTSFFAALLAGLATFLAGFLLPSVNLFRKFLVASVLRAI